MPLLQWNRQSPRRCFCYRISLADLRRWGERMCCGWNYLGHAVGSIREARKRERERERLHIRFAS